MDIIADTFYGIKKYDREFDDIIPMLFPNNHSIFSVRLSKEKIRHVFSLCPSILGNLKNIILRVKLNKENFTKIDGIIQMGIGPEIDYKLTNVNFLDYFVIDENNIKLSYKTYAYLSKEITVEEAYGFFSWIF